MMPANVWGERERIRGLFKILPWRASAKTLLTVVVLIATHLQTDLCQQAVFSEPAHF
jgi:hypothetical protein